MNKSNHEELSAFVDGALGKSETAFMLRRLEHDAELRGCYERYHLIRDCLRNPATTQPVRTDLAARIRLALNDEIAPRRTLPWRAGMQWAAGVATAAVVATGAFLYVQPRSSSDVMLAGEATSTTSEVAASGVRANDLRRQLPLLPVSARQSRPLLRGEFAPQPDPEAWQRAPVTSLHYPSTQYIVILPATRMAPEAGENPAR